MATFRPKSALMLRSSGYAWAEYAPHPALAPWVSLYWTLETQPGEHVLRCLPDTCIDLTLRLHAGSVSAQLTGAQRQAQQWTMQGPMQLVGARLVPGACAPLGLDASALEQTWSPLAAHLPQASTRSLLQKAMRAPDAPARVRVLEAFLLERMLNRELDPRLSRAIAAVFSTRGVISVSQLAARAGASARTLGRLFERDVGLAPKRFARIVRVQAALRELPDQRTWTPLALELGYHDQAHFIHDVRALFGASPRELVRLAAHTR